MIVAHILYCHGGYFCDMLGGCKRAWRFEVTQQSRQVRVPVARWWARPLDCLQPPPSEPLQSTQAVVQRPKDRSMVHVAYRAQRSRAFWKP